ncbi:UPF0158 family protein [Clostridium celatum]|uniref:UPF0158 family protein n=1 Tax=Clostridium celatum TaxID=36834 RepID=UPI00290816FC|nr:UPF0158 family protein [Clostridium celatum]MDY3359594.1 UPF0158 family protein [Clostridium celatum]
MKVNLSDLIECIEFEGELLSHYYNKKTGVIIYKEDSSTSSYKAEDIKNLESFEEWERELIVSLNDLKENPSDYIQLPNKDEIDEYGMMEMFCNTLENKELEQKILGEVNGKDKFRELREAIQNNGLMNEWYDYRENAEKQLAIKWCKDNAIEYTE